LKIPATSGIPYKVKSWDSLLAIALKYKIKKDKILEFNGFSNSKRLKIWEEMFLPWAKKIVTRKPTYKTPSRTYARKTKKTNYVWNRYTSSKWVYKLKWRKPYSGAWWNCTYYVASYKGVNWRWNANRWMRNAKAKWHKVVYGRWFAPKLGSIVVLEWRWYNLRYGHVAIVMEIKKNYMIVSDMNYRRLNEVTYRKVSLNSRNITWYIYVN
jgi:surface antigen